MELQANMFNGRTDARLVKIDYEVLPIAMNQSVNISNQDEILITRVEDKAVSMEITRRLVVTPKSLFDIKATCFLRRNLGENVDVPSLKTMDMQKFINDHKVEMTNIAFMNLAHLIANITASFGGAPLMTPPAPAQNTPVTLK